MSENKVLATVNGKQITENDVNMFLQGLGQERAMQLNSEQGRQRVLNEIINQELFFCDAKESGLDQDEEFKQELEQMKKMVLTRYAVGKFMRDITVDDAEVVKYYNENQEQFKAPESIRASHILVDDEIKANKIMKQIQDGLSFEEAAKENSKCPSKDNGGDLGFFPRGKMVPEFEEKSFSMKVGEISKPVKTQFGYHIIKVVDKKEDSVYSLEEIKSQLVQQLTAQKQDEAYQERSKELKEKNDVVINK